MTRGPPRLSSCLPLSPRVGLRACCSRPPRARAWPDAEDVVECAERASVWWRRRRGRRAEEALVDAACNSKPREPCVRTACMHARMCTHKHMLSGQESLIIDAEDNGGSGEIGVQSNFDAKRLDAMDVE
eukprot:6206365-Pleurochrysis_carterae.AAC.1